MTPAEMIKKKQSKDGYVPKSCPVSQHLHMERAWE